MAVRSFVPTQQPEPMPGARILGLRADDEFRVAERIQAGFSTATVGRLARSLGVPDSRVLSYVGIPESTFHARKRKNEPLSPEESSRVYRLAKVVAAAEEFFENDRDAALRWLSAPKMALGGDTPVAFARTPEGSDYVVKLLGRMAHGVIS